MASKRPDFLSSLDVPHFDSSVVGSGDKCLVIELESHHAIIVGLEDFDGTASVLPVCANLEAIFVNVFPRPLFGLIKV